jgi:hypothetical protein
MNDTKNLPPLPWQVGATPGSHHQFVTVEDANGKMIVNCGVDGPTNRAKAEAIAEWSNDHTSPRLDVDQMASTMADCDENWQIGYGRGTKLWMISIPWHDQKFSSKKLSEAFAKAIDWLTSHEWIGKTK